MALLHAVLDTNVLVAALRSCDGASYRLLSLIGRHPRLRIHLTVPLVVEYEATAKRHAEELGLTVKDVDVVLDYLCSVADLHEVYFLWRPLLRDPRDDMVLQAAVTAGSPRIITFNKRHFAGAEQFGIVLLTPAEFLKELGELK